MSILEKEKLEFKPLRCNTLHDSELPLQQIYAGEQFRAAQLLFSQPVHGLVREWTWGSVILEARRMAGWLKAQGWPPGSRIVILSKNCAWWLMADFAIWMAGHVSVPFFPAASSATLETLFRHSQPVACFLGQFDHPLPFGEEVFGRIACVAFPTFSGHAMVRDSAAWEEIVAHAAPLEGHPYRNGDEIATIIYTSGTTGQPKGAMHSFHSLSLMGKSMEPAFEGPARGGDRILSYLPLAHIAERAIVEMNALFMPLHIFFAESQETFLVDLKRARPTLFFSVPRLYIRFQQKVLEKIPEARLNRLLAVPLLNGIVRKVLRSRLGLECTRIVAGGGAATPVETIRWYRKLGLNFIEGYGMTETGITHVPLPGRDRVGYVGNASQYAETRIAADGEVQIKGPMNMAGYYRSPELTRAAFTEDGYFHTGDHGEIDAHGRLRLIGRLKEEFKTAKGKFVVPSHIEELLMLSTFFETSAIFGSGMTMPFAMAVLVPEKRRDLSAQEDRGEVERELLRVIDHVNAHLEPHERLRSIVVCMEPWTTANGLITPTLKVRRSAIEQQYAPRFKEWEKCERRVIWLENL